MESNNAVEPFKNSLMWDTLISTLHGNSDSNLYIILNMIKKILAYDDPGLFPVAPMDNEEYEYTKACNLWLINQLIYFTTNERSNGSLTNNLELQTEILSACLLKQPCIFPIIMKRYIELLKILLGKPASNIEINTFSFTTYDLSVLHPNCTLNPIKFTNDAAKYRLIECCLYAITHGIKLIVNINDELMVESSKVVLEALTLSKFEITIASSTFFVTVLKNLNVYSIEMKHQITVLLLSLTTILSSQLAWLNDRDSVENFNRIVQTIFKSLKVGCLAENEADVKDIMNISLDFIKISCASEGKTASVNQFSLVSIVDFLFKYLELRPVNKSKNVHKVGELIELAEVQPMLIKLLKQLLLRQLSEETKTLWNSLAGIVDRHMQSLTRLSSRNVILQIFDLIRVVNHELHLKEVSHLFPNEHLVHPMFNHLLDPKYQETTIAHFTQFVNDLTLQHLTLDTCRFIITMAYNLLTLFSDPPTNELESILIAPFLTQMPPNSIFDDVPNSLKQAFRASEEFTSVIDLSCEFVLKLSQMTYQPHIVQYLANTTTDENMMTLFIRFHYLILEFSDWSTFIEKNEKLLPFFTANLKEMLCIMSQDTLVLRLADRSYVIKCPCCDVEYFTETSCAQAENLCETKPVSSLCQGLVIQNHHNLSTVKFTDSKLLIPYFQKDDKNIRLNMIKSLPAIIAHTKNGLLDAEGVDVWTGLIAEADVDIINAWTNNIKKIMSAIDKKLSSQTEKEAIILKILENIIKPIQTSIRNTNAKLQLSLSKLVNHLATCDIVNEVYLAKCVKCQIHFLICTNSTIQRKASVLTRDMIQHKSKEPINIFNWYKQYFLKLIVHLCVHNYLKEDISIYKSINMVTKTFSFSGPRVFIWKQCQLMLAMLLPWCIRFPKVSALLEEISEVDEKDLASSLSTSFLTIYSYLSLNEPDEVNDKCIDFVIENTASNLYHLLQSDITRTVAEILIFYHKNPQWVMHAFRNLLSKEDQPTKMTLSEMSEFIATRFLGVITFIEKFLINIENEKWLKEEALLSLGEIIRFMGTNLITPFRFKILAMLKMAMAVHEHSTLKDACAKVWSIFIHTIDVECLGPLLSTIFVSLETLLHTHPDEVNSIFRYLVITNGNLLSLHIPDLYFIENAPVDEAVKTKIKVSCAAHQKTKFADQLRELIKHVNHENPTVRTYGLKHLTRLFKSNRRELNHLIFAQNTIDPVVENLLETLIVSCKNVDQNLKLAAGECIGELGAIEPSLFPPNYAPQEHFSLSIHTDSFAKTALVELCKAYQFQKETKYVDCFSLAIQEILLNRGVNPKLNKKVEVWEAIPERQRQLMEPLLHSTYCVGLLKTSSVKVHPIFGSAASQTCQDWGFLWASKMIEMIKDETTKHLLDSFKPSISRDMNILAMFLPYIILHTLQGSNDPDCTQKIFEELQFLFSTVIAENKTLNFIVTTHTPKSEMYHAMDDKGLKCAKLAFCQLDFLEKWSRQWKRIYPASQKHSNITNNGVVVEDFLKKFDKKFLAQANFVCEEYSRALIYLEEYIAVDRDGRLQNELPLLEQIYAKLMDPDSLEGVMCVKNREPTLNEKIRIYNITGRLHESAACFERMMQLEPISLSNMNEMVQCYLGLDQPETALLVAESLINKLYDDNVENLLQETKAEPLWRLGRFEELDELFQNNEEVAKSTNWGVQCGKLLLDFRNNNNKQFHSQIETMRLNILRMFHNSEMVNESAYEIGYQNVMKLHLITEFESAYQLLDAVRNIDSNISESRELIRNFLEHWDARLELIQPSANVIEPVIGLRRIILSETKQLILSYFEQKQQSGRTISEMIDQEISKLWMKSTEYASKANMFQRANLYILNAEQYKPKELFLEKAKLSWKKGDQPNAFNMLENGIAPMLAIARDGDLRKLPKSMRKIYAEAKLLIAEWNAEKVNIGTELNLKYFKESVSVFPESEKSLVQLAAYLDQIYASMSEKDQSEKGGTILLEIVTYYGKSMEYGCNFIYQSMPRLLSIWFDYTSLPLAKRIDENYRQNADNMTKTLEHFFNTLPTFLFFTAFSQLVSRICHPSQEVYNALKTILIKLITYFPQQCLWLIMSVFKSSYTNRVKRCTELFYDKRLSDPAMQVLIRDFNSLAERFIELTNKEITKDEAKPTVSGLVKGLPKLLNDKKFSEIVMPIEKYMQLVMPPFRERDKSAGKFDAFPNHLVYIVGVREEVAVLMSLQRPRRITLIGSDGKDYVVMLKPKDDLRKDYRLMEFNAVVKEYLYQDPEARHRRLHIRTYQVIPLNEECGMIEWVNNLSTFRQVLNNIYKQRDGIMTLKELRVASCKITDSIEKKREVFTKVLVKRHPDVFNEWFRECFSNPHNWYQARSSYIKTTAVMCIVGYILGLGDRHGENILYDGSNGDTVHVDFNCLFNKGESLEFPEVVPFRLTHNMTHAMGPLGVEGLFRKSCEITLRVLQSQTPTLMSVLRPFVYDPLVGWGKMLLKNDGNTTERTDPHALNNIQQIEQRLKGYVKINGKLTSLPLSTEGQVNFLITEAMSLDNLASMYIGWGGFM